MNNLGIIFKSCKKNYMNTQKNLVWTCQILKYVKETAETLWKPQVTVVVFKLVPLSFRQKTDAGQH